MPVVLRVLGVSALFLLLVSLSIQPTQQVPPEEPNTQHHPANHVAARGPYLESTGLGDLAAFLQEIQGTSIDCGNGLDAVFPQLDANNNVSLLTQVRIAIDSCWWKVAEQLPDQTYRNTHAARRMLNEGTVDEELERIVGETRAAIAEASQFLDEVHPASAAELEALGLLMQRVAVANQTLETGLNRIAEGKTDRLALLEGTLDNLEFALGDAKGILFVAESYPWGPVPCTPSLPTDLFATTHGLLDRVVANGTAWATQWDVDVQGLIQHIDVSLREDLEFAERRSWEPAALAVLYEARIAEAGLSVPPVPPLDSVARAFYIELMQDHRSLYVEHLLWRVLVKVENPVRPDSMSEAEMVNLVGSAVPNPFLAAGCPL